MTRISNGTAAVLFLGLAAACQRHYPEGGYSCSLPQRPGDCPPSWYCRSDLHCYSTPDDAAAITDAGTVDAARVDASGPGDAGPPNDAWSSIDVGLDARECVAETCDAVDNDCDGRVDEGLATVSPPHYFPITGYGLSIVPTQTGWGVLYDDASNVTSGVPYWASVNAAGDPGTPVSLGNDFVGSLFGRASGDTVVMATASCIIINFMSPPACTDTLRVFRQTNGTRIAPPGAAPYTFQAANPMGAVGLGAVDTTRVSVYQGYGTTTPFTLRRYRMSLDRSTPSIAAMLDVAQVPDGDWAVAVAASDEVVAVPGSAGLQLYLTASRDSAITASALGTLTDLPTDVREPLAVSVPDPSMPISAANPLAIAMMRPRPNGIVVAVVTGTMPLSYLPPVSLPGSAGGNLYTSVRIVAAGGPGTPRFYIAALDDAGGNNTTLRAWELVVGDTTARMLPIADDWIAVRSRLDMAFAGGTVRILEDDDSSQIVTRTIGCH